METKVNSDIKTDDDGFPSGNITNLDLTRQVLKKIREYMKAEKISMSEFARQTGVSKAWLSKLKHTDANLSLNTAQDLLHYMGYTLKLTREGIKIGRSRLKKYANTNYKNSVTKDAYKDSIKNKQETLYNEVLYKEADGVQQVSPTPPTTSATAPAATVTTTTAPASTPTPIKLNPGQTLTVSASVQDSVQKSTQDSVQKSTQDSVQNAVQDSAREFVSTNSNTDFNRYKAASIYTDDNYESLKVVAGLKRTNNKDTYNDKDVCNDKDTYNEFALLYQATFFSAPGAKK